MSLTTWSSTMFRRSRALPWGCRALPKRVRSLQLCAEPLENRTLPSVVFTPGSYAVSLNRPDVAPFRGGYDPVEPAVSVNRTDPGNVAISSQNWIQLSTNGGGIFPAATAFYPPPGATEYFGDTTTAFDADGRLFWANLFQFGDIRHVSVTQLDPNTAVQIGTASLVPVPPGLPRDDKPFLVADNDPAGISPYRNNLYVAFSRLVPLDPTGQWRVFFARSTNHAASWTNVRQLSTDAEGLAWGCTVASAPNGDVYVAYHSQPDVQYVDNFEFDGFRHNPDGRSGQVIVFRSTDGGVTFPQRTVAFSPGQADVTFNTQDAANGGNIPGTQFWTVGSAQPWVLADPVRPGTIYVIAADDPDHVHGAGDDADVVLTRSTDYGLTWTVSTVEAGPVDEPGTVNNSFQLFPTAAIDPFGNLVVAWYDNRRGLTNGAGRFLLDVFAKYSTDGGLTWSDAFMVNDATNSFDPDAGAVHRFDPPGGPPTTRIGEYFGLDLYGGTAYVAWNGNTFSGSQPVGQQVWFGSFGIQGALTVIGTPGDDTITIRSMADNTDFVEVLVNGRREYAGLWSALTGITVAATAGNDTVNIEDTAAGVPVTVNLGDGTDAVNLSPTARNLDRIHGKLTINGQAGTVVACYDQSNSGGQTYTITGATLARSGSALVTFSTLGSLVLNGSSGGDTFIAQSTPAGTAVTFNGGGGTNTVVGSDAANIWSITSRNAGTLTRAVILGPVSFSSVQNLTGGADADTFRFADGQGVDGIIDGGRGSNMLDYSAYTGNIIVNLQLNSATGVGGGVANIQNVTGGGGPGYNILVGNGGNVLRGGNGRNLLIAGVGASTLIGGTDENILIGGTTSYDTMPEQLMAIMNYWTGTDDYDSRVFNLTHGIGVPLLDATTVTGNGGGNTLTGGPGRSLFYGNLALDSYDWDPLTETFIAV